MPRRVSRAVACLSGLCSLALIAGCPTRAEGTATKAPPSAAAAKDEAPAAAPKREGAAAAAVAPEAVGPTVVLSPPGHDPLRVRVEVARNEQERRVGLMYRKHLDADAGMLFLFEKQEPLTFWMHNTYVPLDMIFITDAMAVLGVVENAEPLTDTPRSVPGASKYVLEVNAGYSRAHGIAAGTIVRFEGVDVAPAEGAAP